MLSCDDDVHDDRSPLRLSMRSSIRRGDDAANDSCGAEVGCSAEGRVRLYSRASSQRAVALGRRQPWVATSGTELAVAAAAGPALAAFAFAIVGVGDEIEVPVMVVAGPFELSEGEAASPERCRQKS